jgi:diguanylate cyclase (GGDEF)-like protein
VAATIAAATAVLAALALISANGLWGYDAPILGRHAWVTAMLGVCAAVSEMRPLRWLRNGNDTGTEVTASWTFMFAMVLTAPPLGAVGLSVLSCVIGDITLRKDAIKVGFNAAQLTTSLGIAAILYRIFGGTSGLGATHVTVGWFGVTVATALIAVILNGLLTSGVVARSTGQRFAALVRTDGISNLSTDVMLLALAPVFAATAERSLLFFPLLLLVTFAVCAASGQAARSGHAANHDSLTDLPNRRLLRAHLEAVVEQAAGRNGQVRLALIDLVGFKDVNDRFGHEIGDGVLKELAGRLVASGRAADLVARLGGDEFAVISPWVDDDRDGSELAARLSVVFSEPCSPGGIPVHVGASIGLATYPADALDAIGLLRAADEAMYANKVAGRHWTTRLGTSPVRAAGAAGQHVGPQRITLLADLSRALGTPQLYLDYQPVVDLADGSFVGAEALLRWDRPQVGLVGPGTFMPLAEHTAIIRPLTEWVLVEALRQARDWHDHGFELPIAVNVSTRNLADDGFTATLDQLLSASGQPPTSLSLEITENALASDLEMVRRSLHELRDIGVTVSLDDFGTGYSSMATLRDLPVDRLKIDRRFVSAIPGERRDLAMVEAMVRLAQALGMTTVAEGIELEQTAGALMALGCRQAQGFLFGRPMRPGDLLERAHRGGHQPFAPA